jgi:VWFA-related protein
MKLRLFCVIGILGCCLAASRAEQKKEEEGFTFAVQTQLVEVYLTVTQGNRLIPNLRAEDFVLTEDGMPVSVDRLDNQEVPLNVVLLVDTSESVQSSLKAIQNAAIAFLNSLHPQDRVTVIFFNSEIVAYRQLAEDREPLVREIRNVRARGITKLYDAMITGMKYLEGKPGRKALVCFTDGQDTSGSSSRVAVLNAAARSGFPIYTIGAGAGLELSTLKIILREFADINSGRAFFIESTDKLRDAFEQVAAELRSAYVLNYYTKIPLDGRWHELNIKTSDPHYTVHSRKGFFAGRTSEP